MSGLCLLVLRQTVELFAEFNWKESTPLHYKDLRGSLSILCFQIHHPKLYIHNKQASSQELNYAWILMALIT